MKVIKAMKIAKRNRKGKDIHDLRTRGYTDYQYKSFEKLSSKSTLIKTEDGGYFWPIKEVNLNNK